MKVTMPDYYQDFSCLAADCKNSCCIGWALEVDAETLAHYAQVPPPFGDRLRAILSAGSIDETDGVCTLSLTVDGRCPFLDNENLCQIVHALGEEALPEICHEYPRSYFSYGDTIERTLLLSCEEAARLLFAQPDMPSYLTHTVAGDATDALSPEEALRKDVILSARERAFAILREHTRPLSDRLLAILSLCRDAEASLSADVSARSETDPLLLAYAAGAACDGRLGEDDLPNDTQLFESFLLRLSILSALEILNDDWADLMRGMNDLFADENSYRDAVSALQKNADRWEDDAARFMNYLIFRNFTPAIYDGRLYDRMRYCLFCLLLLRDTDAFLAQKNGGRFSKSDRIQSVSLFSREIEHSDINPDIILDELMFS